MVAKKEDHNFLSTKNKILLFILISSITIVILNPFNPTALVIKVGDEYIEWSQTHWMTDIEFAHGSSIKIGATERIRMWIFDDNHYIGILNKTNTYATFVSSNSLFDPVIIHPGEEEYFEVTDDNRYDIYVKFNNFDYVNNKINITIRATNQQVINETLQEQQTSAPPPQPKRNTIPKKTPIDWANVLIIILLSIISIILIGVVVFHVWRHFKPKTE